MLYILKIFLFVVCFNFRVVFSVNSNLEEEVINEILRKNITSADVVINKIPYNPARISEFVHRIYNGTEQNFFIILHWAQLTKYIEISAKALKALRSEMVTHGHHNPIYLMELAHSIQYEILSQTNGKRFAADARALFNETMKEIERISLDYLKTAMIANTFQEDSHVQQILKYLFNFDENLSDRVVEQLMHQTFGRILSVKMADNIFDASEKIPQIITGLLSLFEKVIDHSNDENSEAVVRITKYIAALCRMHNYYTTPKKKKIAVNKFILRLPTCVRNVYFARFVCIRNRGKDEFLFASVTQFDFTRRTIFTAPIEDIGESGVWKAEEVDNIFYFTNRAYEKEYLYASTSDRYKGTGARHAETWMDDGFVGETSAWSIEAHGDYCYLKNVNFNEYLFVTDEKHGEGRRYVFTSKSNGTAGDGDNFLWQIHDCA